MNRGFVVLFALAALVSQAQATDFHFGADVVSGYVWRGQAVGSASAVAVQPSAVLDAGAFSVTARANSFVQDRDVLGGVTEVQVLARHTFALREDSTCPMYQSRPMCVSPLQAASRTTTFWAYYSL